MTNIHHNAISLFYPALAHSSKRLLGWSFFWLFTFTFLSLIFNQTVLESAAGPFLAAVVLQGGFPIFFLSVYFLNKKRETDKSAGWLNLFLWVKDATILKNSGKLAFFHVSFYFLLGLLTLGINQIILDKASPTISSLVITFFTQSLLGFFFLSITWEMPALIAEGNGLRTSLKQSFFSLSKHWKTVTLFSVYLHIPSMLAVFGFYLATRGLQAFAAAGRIPMPDKLIESLVHTAPIGLFLFFIGSLLQFLFWLIFLVHGYSPMFWSKIHENETKEKS